MWVVVIGLGILYTFYLKGLSFTKLGMALKLMFKRDSEAEGEISAFGAICTTLAGNLGTGNIVGVATALVAGGPGALFWIWVVAAFGMATKYAEGLLAVKYRTVDENGHALGGPFYYIERGLGAKWRWLAKLFGLFGATACALGVGTFTQINGVVDATVAVFDPENKYVAFGGYSWVVVIVSIVAAIVVAMVLAGGLKRTAAFAEIVVPVMAVIYIIYCLLILLFNIKFLPTALYQIFYGAFNPVAATGGAIGSAYICVSKGIARGVFSSETCLGSAPIAAASAKTDSAEKQGLVTMTSNFVDTLLVCTATGIAIIMTGAWDMGLDGVAVTTQAFILGVPILPAIVPRAILMICLVSFAFTTCVGWEYYGERCFEYLANGSRKACYGYRVFWVVAVLFGAFMTVTDIWTIADIVCGLMAFPNSFALLMLFREVGRDTNTYFSTHTKAEILKSPQK